MYIRSLIFGLELCSYGYCAMSLKFIVTVEVQNFLHPIAINCTTVVNILP